MFFFDMFFAVGLALLLVLLLIPTGRYHAANGGPAWLLLFPMLFLLIWAAGAWLTPIGAPVAGVYWMSFLIPALFLGLLLFALATPSGPARKDDDVIPENASEEAAAGTVIAFTAFFWILLLAAVAAIILHYS